MRARAIPRVRSSAGNRHWLILRRSGAPSFFLEKTLKTNAHSGGLPPDSMLQNRDTVYRIFPILLRKAPELYCFDRVWQNTFYS
jgi:hypothetical protein